MTAPVSRPAEHSAHLGHLWWLSAGGAPAYAARARRYVGYGTT